MKLLHLLERSAELLERSAEQIRIAHTVGGRWPRNDEHGAKRDFQELRDMAKGFWSTISAVCVPPYAWYLVVERGMAMAGLIS